MLHLILVLVYLRVHWLRVYCQPDLEIFLGCDYHWFHKLITSALIKFGDIFLLEQFLAFLADSGLIMNGLFSSFALDWHW